MREDNRAPEGAELQGWKTIANHLGVTDRTAQLRERERGLPIHRYPGGRGRVYAFVAELESWKRSAARDNQAFQQRVAPTRSGRIATLLGGGSFLAILLWAAVAGIHRIENEPAPASAPLPLTSTPGLESAPDLSPDGTSIVFVSSTADGGETGVYTRRVSGGPRKLVAKDTAAWCFPRWAPDGDRIAFTRDTPAGVDVILASLASGEERLLTRLAGPERQTNVLESLSLAWTTDGGYVAVAERSSSRDPFRIVLVSAATGQRVPLTAPPAGIPGDTQPAFSPDGRFVAFVRYTTWSEADLYLLPMGGGAARRLTRDHARILGVAWTPDGGALVFSSHRGSGRAALYMLTVGVSGLPRTLVAGEANAQYPSVGRRLVAGKTRLVYQERRRDMNIWSVDLRGGREPLTVVASTWPDHGPVVSSDGGRLAFVSQRSGTHEVWVRRLEGGMAEQMTALSGPYTDSLRWSPDGRQIAFTSESGGNRDIYAVDLTLRKTLRLATAPSEEGRASWSRDGQWLYYRSDRAGGQQIWKQAVNGGEPIQVTTGGGYEAFEGPGGRHLFYVKERERPGLWVLPVDSGVERLVLDGVWESRWAVARDAIYFLAGREIKRFELSTGHLQVIYRIRGSQELRANLAVSPDGTAVLWSQVDVDSADLRLMDF